jgi:hypothetical protein
MFDMRDRNGAATLMADEGIDPAAAIGHAVLRDLIQQGHLTQGEFDDIYGPGAFDAVSRGPAPRATFAAANQGGRTGTPNAAPGNGGQKLSAQANDEADASFGEDDPVFAPVPGTGAPQWEDAGASAPQGRAAGAPPIPSTPPPEGGDDKPSQPIRARTIEGRETGPSDSQPFRGDLSIDDPVVLAAGGAGKGPRPPISPRDLRELFQLLFPGNRSAPTPPSTPPQEWQGPPGQGAPGTGTGAKKPPVAPAIPQAQRDAPTPQPGTRPIPADQGFDPSNLQDKLQAYLQLEMPTGNVRVMMVPCEVVLEQQVPNTKMRVRIWTDGHPTTATVIIGLE